MTPPDPADTPVRPVPRQVFVGEEYGEINVPLDLVLKGDALNIYEEVLGRNLFRIQLRKKKLVFQAGGFLGVFPLNDSVALEVRSRVPINNLERILLWVPEYTPDYVPGHMQTFQRGIVKTPSLLDLLALRLTDAVEQVHMEGLHYEYLEKQRIGTMPRGRMLPFASVRRQMTSGQPLSVFSAFERTHDTPLNRCLRLAIIRLLVAFGGMRDREGARAIVSRLALADRHFARVRIDESMAFFRDRLLFDPTTLPLSKPSYRVALPIASVVLRDQGIVIRTHDGDVILPSVLVSMEKVFEGYTRAVLRKLAQTDGSLSVLDGNQSGPLGAARPLFDEPDESTKGNKATPDIVICRQSPLGHPSVELVIDAKYKPLQHQPDRADMDQVFVYGLVYRCKRVALAYPRRSNTEDVVQRVGSVNGIELFKVFLDLGASDLKNEEKRMVAAIGSMLGGD